MSIKNSKLIYITDRGEEYYVKDMDNSHLSNTIAHIHRKVMALASTRDNFLDEGTEEFGAIQGHITCLREDQRILLTELASRESCKDEC